MCWAPSSSGNVKRKQLSSETGNSCHPDPGNSSGPHPD